MGVALMSAALMSSCDVLDEQQRAGFDPAFFSTDKGVEGGLTALYAHLRNVYGQAYYYNITETGTDEYTYAESADGNFKAADLSGVEKLDGNSCRADVIWYENFSSINNASGVIENAMAANISEAIVSEARFIRAFDYFQLVQTYGGVPLDLGSGVLKFNTTPKRTSSRNTVPEVYTKAIFPDLRIAVDNLPDNPRLTGTVTKNVARLALAKAYLTYAWWLENPKNIPTYPACDRVDPDGKNAAWYFQQAYDIALDAINDKGPYDLMESFQQVYDGANDRNKEQMLWADHTEASEYYNGGSLSWGNGGAPDNFAGWMGTWNYTTLVSTADDGSSINPCQREAAQMYGRPWTRMAPTIGACRDVFNDKKIDSRFDGTFTYVWRANYDKASIGNAYVIGANDMKVYPGKKTDAGYVRGDKIASFLTEETAGIDFSKDNNKGFGTLAGHSDYVANLSDVSRIAYPCCWKIGTYRTDSGDGLGSPNGGSTRPFVIMRFAELYFIAAEANVKGATAKGGMDAKALLNVIRARAGKWAFSNNEQKMINEDHSAEMVAATPATITIDYILDERMREFFGEGLRWFDLVRTQTWVEKAGTYEICNFKDGKIVPQVNGGLLKVNRTIEPYHYLRPIPQGQLDGMEGTEEELEAYKNPGYNK